MASDTPQSASGSRPSRVAGLLALVLLYAAILAPLPFQGPPEPRPASAPDSAFSAERAMEHVRALAAGPRPIGSPAHDSARAYLVSELEALGLEVRVDSALTLRAVGSATGVRPVLAASVRNVLARLPAERDPGEDPPPATLALLAHYDSRELTPGAGDDATGVAAILEAVRAIRAGPPLAADLHVLVTDGEEMGLFGARSLLERSHPWVEPVDLVINVEMRGAAGRAVLFETSAGNLRLVREAAAADPSLVGSSLFTELYRRIPSDTDLSPFLRAGHTGLNLAGAEDAARYHHPSDTPENLDPGTLQDHGNHLVALARHFGAAEAGGLAADADAVFHHVPGLGTVVYSTAASLPLAILAVLLWAGVLVWGVVSGRTRWPAVLAGAGAALGVVVLGALVGRALVAVGPTLRPEWGPFHGTTAWAEGPLVLLLAAAVVAAALGAVSALLGLWRSADPRDGGAALGAALPALAGGVLLSAAVPSVGMILVWPVLLATGGAALALALPRHRLPHPGRTLRPLLLALPAAAVLWLLTPLVRVVWAALGLSAGVAMGALAGLALTLVLPLLLAAVRPARLLVPLLAVVPVVAALAAALPAREPSESRPLPSALLHLHDADEGRSFWAVPEGGPAEEWSAARVRADDEPAPLPGFGPASPRRYRTGPAPGPPAGLPTAEVVVDGGRIRVRSRIGSERLSLFPAGPGADGLRLVAVSGRPIRVPEGGWELVHYGRPLGGTLEVEVEPVAGEWEEGEAPSLVLVEHGLRPSELLGDVWPSRPPHLAPAVWTPSDRVLVRSRIRLAPDGGGGEGGAPAALREE